MTFFQFVLQSLRFHWRSHLGTGLGAVIGSAVLIGALVVGDSVRESLRAMAVTRLGQTELALAANDRLIQTRTATSLAQALGAPTAPLLMLLASANTPDGSARANQVQLIGANESFWEFGLQPPSFELPGPDEVILNERLASQLNVQIGEVVLVRGNKPSALSRDAPIAPQEDFSVALRVTVKGIARAEESGVFSLQANQIPPFNAFVSLAWLQEKLEIAGQANLLLAGPSSPPAPAARANELFRQVWELEDAQLELRALPDGSGLELRSSRVFLDGPIVEAAQRAAPGARRVLTYLVNALRAGGRATPYSMVTAIGPPLVPPEMEDHEILINEWLAKDLGAAPGAELSLQYYVVGAGRQLEERENRFRIRAVLSLEGSAADRTLMPDFPGFVEAQSCRDWDAGFAIDLDQLRPEDQAYWDEYRGTPKAFVTLRAGQEMWSNRFGNFTAVRFPRNETDTAGSLGPFRDSLQAALLRELDPASIGLNFEAVRERALAASAQGQDFGQLFLGFSFFLIGAALLLMSLLFQFSTEQRANEVGTLLALGFASGQVRRLLLGEGIGVALVSGLIGVGGGILYAKAMLHGLSTVWRSAVGTSELEYYASASTLALGALASVLVAAGTIWLALRKQIGQPARELLAEGAGSEGLAHSKNLRPGKRGLWIGLAASGAAFILTLAAARQESGMAGLFFGAGALLLVAGLAFSSAVLQSMRGRISARNLIERASQPSLAGLSARNCARRPKRSLATLGLLSCGSFLVMSIGVFRLDADREASQRASGTGGFALIGESSLPIVHDLNSAEGQDFLGLDAEELSGVRFVPMRVRDGEDASCLNLNRAQQPRLLGVRPEALQEREAFTFVKVLDGWPRDRPWMLLNQSRDPSIVPAIGDQASVQWALGKKVGDTLDYVDEQGRPFKLQIVATVANSILQGSLLLSEEAFLERFSREEGYRMFLIDAPSNEWRRVSENLSRALRDFGCELTAAADRLAAYNAVQNTYLNTFQILGGLGLLLGSFGLGVVVLRNVLERRQELAVMLALGFRPPSVRWMVLSEHGALLAAGMGLGLAAALVAVLPTLLSPGLEVPVQSLGVTLLAVLGSGAFWTWMAARWALRGQLLDALRNN